MDDKKKRERRSAARYRINSEAKYRATLRRYYLRVRGSVKKCTYCNEMKPGVLFFRLTKLCKACKKITKKPYGQAQTQKSQTKYIDLAKHDR